jgi:hypothetical protein
MNVAEEFADAPEEPQVFFALNPRTDVGHEGFPPLAATSFH